jgi:hypothetical protein
VFLNRSSRELNLRLVLAGAPGAGHDRLLRELFAWIPDDSKGSLFAVHGASATLFFDFLPPGLGTIRGFALRLHLYAYEGEAQPGDVAGLLQTADGVIFVHDPAQPERSAAWRAAIEQTLEAAGFEPSKVPYVFAAPGGAVPDPGGRPCVALDAASGTGAPDVIMAATRACLVALKEDRLREWRPGPAKRHETLEFLARARVVGHLSDWLGEVVEEREPLPGFVPEGRPGFIAVVLKPASGAGVVCATAGLGLSEQAPGGPEPRLELVARCPQADLDVVNSLVMLARMVLLAGPDEAAYKAYDTVDLTETGLAHARFVLVPAPGADDHPFPDPQRADDLRFTLALPPGAEAEVAFLQLVPVTARELAFAAERGSRTLLERMAAAGHDPALGWGRGEDASVV